jgi:hypothetical protein
MEALPRGAELTDLFESNFAYCRKFGFDEVEGGLYDY